MASLPVTSLKKNVKLTAVGSRPLIAMNVLGLIKQVAKTAASFHTCSTVIYNVLISISCVSHACYIFTQFHLP
jgi:predicted CDP-diglyceride synthetase/phosphatidate cytidylyltransferase